LARLLLISGASLVRLWAFLSVFVCERIAVFWGVRGMCGVVGVGDHVMRSRTRILGGGTVLRRKGS